MNDSRSPPVPEFEVRVQPAGEAVTVVLVGELDIVTVDELRARLDELTSAGFTRLVLDLRELSFMDSSGLQLVIEREADARRSGVELSLIEGPRQVQRLFELSGMLERLPFRAT
jgi:anti-anti-sigma factor